VLKPKNDSPKTADTNGVIYAINPVSLVGLDIYFYRLVVYEIKENRVLNLLYLDDNKITTKKYDGTMPLAPNKIVKIDGFVTQPNTTTKRKWWGFKRPQEAFIQKLILLEETRKLYTGLLDKYKQNLNGKISSNISEQLKEQKNENPEYLF